MPDLKVMMFYKKRNPFCQYAEFILKSHFHEDDILLVSGNLGDPLPEDLAWYNPEYVISFLSPWIIPKQLLGIAKTAAINFHPGSPDYPGTGCYNLALYEGAAKYGVTVHHMKERVDTGNIIMTAYFETAAYDTVESLKLKSMNRLLSCFEEIAALIAKNAPLPQSEEHWRREPFTRKRMLELFEIDPARHGEEEVRRRIRASAYPGCEGACVTVAGHKFFYPIDKREPIA